jgi:hypothetical protein
MSDFVCELVERHGGDGDAELLIVGPVDRRRERQLDQTVLGSRSEEWRYEHAKSQALLIGHLGAAEIDPTLKTQPLVIVCFAG